MPSTRRTTVRGWRWRPNPLRRHSDVVEGWITVVAWVAATVGGTMAGLLGADAAAHAVEQRREGRQLVRAVLTEPAPQGEGDGLTGSVVDRVRAEVSWTDGGGTVHRAEAKVVPGTRAGAEVTLWTDGRERPVSAPPGAAEAATRVALTGTGCGLAGGFALLGGGLGVRLRVERRAVEQWGAAWDRVGPQWGRRPG